MTAQNRAEYMRAYRSYAGGQPVRKFGGDLRFGRFVERARRSPRGRKRITLDELAFETGISPKTIGRIARSQETVSVQHAWIIGQTFRRLGVMWSSGLFALAAAGFDVELLGVIGLTLGPMVQERAPYVERNWHVLKAAPFCGALQPLLVRWAFVLESLREYPYLDDDQRKIIVDAVYDEDAEPKEIKRGAKPSRAAIFNTSDDELVAAFEVAWQRWSASAHIELKCECRHLELLPAITARLLKIERSKLPPLTSAAEPNELGSEFEVVLQRSIARVFFFKLLPAIEAHLCTIEASKLSSVTFDDELVEASEIAWQRWIATNSRDQMPAAFRYAINLLDRRVGHPSSLEFDDTWHMIQHVFFAPSNIEGFCRLEPVDADDADEALSCAIVDYTENRVYSSYTEAEGAVFRYLIIRWAEELG